MKFNLFLFFLTGMIFQPGCTVNDKPYGLMVEFIREPEHVNILDMKPEFSWIVPEKAASQKAYQILVASSEKKIRNNEADIWDSDLVNDSNSTEIEFGGKDLQPGSSYCWKVRILDEYNNLSDYSEIQFFKTGQQSPYATTGNRFQSELIKPVKIEKVADSHFFIDFGKDAFGKLLLNFAPTSKDTIIIHLGEKLDNLNHIDRNPGGSIRYYRVLLPVEPGTKSYMINLPPDERNTGGAAVHA